MDFGPAKQPISDLHDTEFGTFDKHATIEFLAELQRWRGMFDALEIAAARRLHELSVTTPADLAAATRRHPRAGNNVFERAVTVARIDAFARPLREGALHGAQVDTLAKVMLTVGKEHLQAFIAALPAIIEHAAGSGATPDDLARTLNRATRALENDDGRNRYEQQRRDTALRTWTDKQNGIFRISGQFDPKSGALLNGRLQGVVSALFAERAPSSCPTDAGRKQDHLRPLALLDLTVGGGVADGRRDHGPKNSADHASADPPGDDRNGDPSTHATSRHDHDDDDQWSALNSGGPSRFGRPEIVIVLDARQQTVEANDGKAVCDWGIPVELPPKTLAELFPVAEIRPVIIANGIVVHAPGEMNLGRTTRLAPRAQRRALRALYPTCAIPGCGVAFSHTEPHHAHFWEHGGGPISTTWCFHSAAATTTTTTTAAPTKAAGISLFNPTEPSPSPSPTTPFTPPDHPSGSAPPERPARIYVTARPQPLPPHGPSRRARHHRRAHPPTQPPSTSGPIVPRQTNPRRPRRPRSTRHLRPRRDFW